ncbi:hypothetical protein ACT3UJ_16365 [Halomonas sp. 86]|uniref:hypothetical protein n=1 Tax=unclassified Halomonas TaxID=2609666 RepID=UPI004033441E
MLGDDPSVLPTQIQERFPSAHPKNAGVDFSAIIEQVITLIEVSENKIKLPQDTQSAVFQERVWKALSPISTDKYCKQR